MILGVPGPFTAWRHLLSTPHIYGMRMTSTDANQDVNQGGLEFPVHDVYQEPVGSTPTLSVW